MFLVWNNSVYSQNKIDIYAKFYPEINNVEVSQKITLTNTSNKKIDSIIINDWNNSYSSNNTELAKRFAEEYSTKFHFSKKKEKGITTINSIKFKNNKLIYRRIKSDILVVFLQKSLLPNEDITITLDYKLQLPSDKFTRFGIDNKKNIKLKEWFLIPAKLKKEWVYYSNKDLDDLYFPNSDINLVIETPKNYNVISDLNEIETTSVDNIKKVTLFGENRINTELHLIQNNNFSSVKTEKIIITSNIDDGGIGSGFKAVIHDKIAFFLNRKLGDYPYDKIVLSNADYKRNPIYGLNQLPNFIRPFPVGFQYEIKIAKTTISKYIKNTFNTNPRKDYWLNDALESYLMNKYIEEFYPDVKLIGTLSNIWGIKTFEIAKKDFNDQYYYFSQYTARKNLDQKLNTQKDSLLKYNVNISNKNRAGIGLLYLDDYLTNDIISNTIKEYYNTNQTKDINSNSFLALLKSKTNKNIDWFFKDYINSNKKIDYKIVNVTEKGNSLELIIKNKRKSEVPFSIYQINNDKIVKKDYVDGFKNIKKIVLENHKPDRVILNYEKIIPEYNLRNNSKKNKPHLLNKPLKLSFIKDAEAPNHNQLFYVPEIGYNYYDGISPGITFSNKTLLRKNFTYKIKPIYGLKSKSLVGSLSTNYTQFYKYKNLFSITYGLSYNQYHYDYDLMYQKLNPYIVFNFRDKKDLRSNANKYIIARNVSVKREKNQFSTDNEPNYDVVNLKAGFNDSNLLYENSFNTDIQFSKDFSRISFNYNFRKTFKNNRQINIRTFLGGFIYNKTDSDFFSFSLDRPQDYLFDYNYYGRSESSGIFSQQIIIAEGGFKSKLETPFANEWMTTLNSNITIWKYIFAYGDVGFLSNNGNVYFVYDSGIHVNLVPDYFELYFPMYSNLGWEVGQPRYAEKIRFKITLSPKVLIGLFTRKWL